MKRYKDYMDGVKVSGTLHEKLKNLEEPGKKSQPWVKWGAMAAALALVVGVGAWGLGQFNWGRGLGEVVDLPAIGTVNPEGQRVPAPDIAPIDPNDPSVDFPAAPNGGGYEVWGEGNGPEAPVAYYVLPYLNWVAEGGLQSLNYLLAPHDAISREADMEDVLAFAGGKDAMSVHLLWDGLDWSGELWFLEDGVPCAAALSANGEGLHFYLEVRKGNKVPSCVVQYSETSQWQGVEITAVKNGGYAVIDGVELNEGREISFFCDGVGYKLTLYAADAARADELCARFVRYAIDNGFHLDALSLK